MAEKYSRSQKMAMQKAKEADMDAKMQEAHKKHHLKKKGPKVKGADSPKGNKWKGRLGSAR